MAKFKHMVDMTRSIEEKTEDRAENTYPTPIADMPDVPYGLCIALTERELDKLGLDEEPEVGDYIHVFAMAKVTSTSSNDSGSGLKRRVELSLVALEVEDEDDEAPSGGRR